MSGYVIMQAGLYWRPNSCGYTSQLRQAGIYDEAFARRVERGGRTPPDRAIQITPEMVEELEAEVSKLQAAIARFRAVLPCPSCRRAVGSDPHLCAAQESPFTGLDDGPEQGGARG